MKSIKVHNHTPSSHRETLPHHEHAARRARAKSVGLPRKQKPTAPPSKPGVPSELVRRGEKPALFLTHRLAQPEIGGFDQPL